MKNEKGSSSRKVDYLERKPKAVIVLFSAVFFIIFAITMGGIVLSVYLAEASVI